jgi:transketolase
MDDEKSSIPGFTKGLLNENQQEKTARNARGVFMETLEELVQKDNRIILVVGDVGFSYMAEFQKKYPKQYINTGVMEQTFMGVAAGLAQSGWKPYIYSMVPFVIMRNYEQLRNDVCYGNQNVKIIGAVGNVHYRFQGMSHNLLGKENEEDLLKNLPNIKRYYPKGTEEVRRIVLETYENTEPTYIRL